MNHFRASDVNFLYVELARELTLRGARVETRGLTTLELTNVTLELYKPLNRFVTLQARNMSMKYFVGELCFYLSGSTKLDFIAHYGKFWREVSDDGKTVNSAYGSRMFIAPHAVDGPFWYAIECLRRDPNSRKAVVPIYAERDSKPSKDNPCTMHMQFLMRSNMLDLHVFMRSNDVWLGVPYDVAYFSLVHEIAFTVLSLTYPHLQLGTYWHHAMSLHVYQRDLDGLFACATQPISDSLQAPPLCSTDTDTWFDDLRTYEMSKRKIVKYRNDTQRTAFQDWCKDWLG